MKIVTAAEAVSLVKSRDRVFVQTAAAAPQQLVLALTARGSELRGVEMVHLHTEGHAPYVAPELEQSFHTNAFFVGPNMRGKAH